MYFALYTFCRALLSLLYGQVLIATLIGVALGHFFPAAGASMKPLGDAFIKLVRMIVAPVVFCTVVVGIAGVGDVKAVGKAGVLTLIYFEIVSTIALVIGLIVVNIVKPGAGMNVDPAALDAGAVAQYVTAGRGQHITDFLLGIIPTSAADAFARSDILQVLLFSVIFGLALNATGKAGSAGLRVHRAAVAGALRHRRHHHADRADRGVRRDGGDDRQLRRRHAGAVDQADRDVLPDVRGVRVRSCWAPSRGGTASGSGG